MITPEDFSAIMARHEEGKATTEDITNLIETIKELDAHATYHQQGTIMISQVAKHIVESTVFELTKILSVRSQVKMQKAAEAVAKSVYQMGLSASLFLQGEPNKAIDSTREYLTGLSGFDALRAAKELQGEPDNKEQEYELTGIDNTGSNTVPSGDTGTVELSEGDK
jgi:hypothetical protein